MRRKPGMYLVGRDDGTVEPFYLLVRSNGIGGCGLANVPDADRALVEDGWWWQVQTVPDALPDPVEWAKIPYLCEEPGA